MVLLVFASRSSHCLYSELAAYYCMMVVVIFYCSCDLDEPDLCVGNGSYYLVAPECMDHLRGGDGGGVANRKDHSLRLGNGQYGSSPMIGFASIGWSVGKFRESHCCCGYCNLLHIVLVVDQNRAADGCFEDTLADGCFEYTLADGCFEDTLAVVYHSVAAVDRRDNTLD